MKRRLLIIGMFLLLGAVVNVAVAWGASISMSRAKLSAAGLLPEEEAKTLWHEYVGVAAPGEVAGERYDGLTIRFIFLLRGSTGDQVYVFVQSGWPTRSMEGSASALAALDDSSLVESHFLTQTDVGPFDYGLLPLRPTWPGFAVNTIFYAALLWLLIPGPFVLRRFLRVRRGLCPKCAYPIGESSVCTECGGELKRARTT